MQLLLTLAMTVLQNFSYDYQLHEELSWRPPSESDGGAMEIPIRSTPVIGKPSGADRAAAYEPFIEDFRVIPEVL